MQAKLPRGIPIGDAELCALLSNGLENALRAAAMVDKPLRKVSLYCDYRMDKLLISISNPYVGEIRFKDGLPLSDRAGKEHGFGCRSIRMITEAHRGLCSFEAELGTFTLQIVLPMNQ